MCGRWPARSGRPRSTGRGAWTTRSQCPRTSSTNTGPRALAAYIYIGVRSPSVSRSVRWSRGSAEAVPAEEAEHVVRADHRPATRATLLGGRRLCHRNRRNRLGRRNDLDGCRRTRDLRFDSRRSGLNRRRAGWGRGRPYGLDVVARRVQRLRAGECATGPGRAALRDERDDPREHEDEQRQDQQVRGEELVQDEEEVGEARSRDYVLRRGERAPIDGRDDLEVQGARARWHGEAVRGVRLVGLARLSAGRIAQPPGDRSPD